MKWINLARFIFCASCLPALHAAGQLEDEFPVETKQTVPRIERFRAFGMHPADLLHGQNATAIFDTCDAVVVATVKDVVLAAVTEMDTIDRTKWYRVTCKIRAVPRGDFPFETMEFTAYSNGFVYESMWPYFDAATYHFGMSQQEGVWKVKCQFRASPFAPYRIEDHVPYFRLKRENRDADYSKWDALVKASDEDSNAYKDGKYRSAESATSVSIEQDKYFILAYPMGWDRHNLTYNWDWMNYVVYSWPDGKLIYDFFDDDNDASSIFHKDRDLFRFVCAGLVYEEESKVAEYTRAIERDPNNAENYRLRADSHTSLLEFEAALSDIAKAVELAPMEIENYRTRDYLYFMIEEAGWDGINVDEATEANYNAALKLFPEDQQSYEGRAQLFIGQGKMDAAFADVARALEIDPASANAYQLRGRAHAHQKEYEKAIQDFTKAVELDPVYICCVGVRRGDIYFLLEEYEKAIADYTEVIEKCGAAFEFYK